MRTHHFYRLALPLLMFASVAGTAMAAASVWVFGMAGWIAGAALLLSAVLVAGVVKLHESWCEARWDAGQRLR